MSGTTWYRLLRDRLTGRHPAYVIAFVTGRCDLRCPSCCHASTVHRRSRELSPDEWREAFTGATSLVHLCVTGGEPFLRDDLPDVIDAIVEATDVPRMSINTNGTSPDRVLSTVEGLLLRHPKLETTLSVSIDGPAEVHDALRGCPGSFARARETVFALRRVRGRHERLRVRVSSLLQDGNADALAPFIDRTARWPLDEHEIVLVRDVPASVQRQLVEPYLALWDRARRRTSLRDRWSLTGHLQSLLVRETAARARGLRARGQCPAGGAMVEVMPDGVVRGCEMEALWSRSVIGDVSAGRDSLRDVMRSPAAREFRKRARDCQCTFECATSCGIVFDPTRWVP